MCFVRISELRGPSSRYGHFGEEVRLLAHLGIEPKFFGRLVWRVASITTAAYRNNNNINTNIGKNT
jgi:hypothetical protein